MDDRLRPARLLVVLALSITLGLAALAGHLVSARDVLTACASGLTMNLVEGALRAFLAKDSDRPGPDSPPADPEPPAGSPR